MEIITPMEEIENEIEDEIAPAKKNVKLVKEIPIDMNKMLENVRNVD
jgi:hypothetical protein